MVYEHHDYQAADLNFNFKDLAKVSVKTPKQKPSKIKNLIKLKRQPK